MDEQEYDLTVPINGRANITISKRDVRFGSGTAAQPAFPEPQLSAKSGHLTFPKVQIT
jgi:hypothetical protein